MIITELINMMDFKLEKNHKYKNFSKFLKKLNFLTQI